MNKILLIIQREYLSRVKKKSFLVLTILVPILFIGMFAIIGYLAAKGDDLGDEKKMKVIDETGMYVNKLQNTNTLRFIYSIENFDSAKTTFKESGYAFLLHISESGTEIELLGEKKPSATTIEAVESGLSRVAEARRLQLAGIDTAVLAQAQKKVSVKAKQLTDAGEKDAQTYTAYAVGFLSAFLIYMCLFIYGTQVMRGVIEEKVSRIIEVIISSVKPFQLMLGKIIGVGMVGLTQFLLWILLSVGLTTVGSSVLAKKMQQEKAPIVNTIPGAQAELNKVKTPENSMQVIKEAIDSIPIAYTVSCFLFYFLFGYFLYSAIFAAVGSAVDNETETQQFMLPITLPLIFTFALSQSFIINNPDSSLSIWLSMIPFTSPIAMMIRIPFGVPAWQLGLSMLLLVLGFVFTTWVAARIYRVGILMYGKKASYKELAKWFMYKE